MTQFQVREPLVYAEDAPRSFFQDLVRSKVQYNDEATARLEEHQRQMLVESPKDEKRLDKTADGGDIEYRGATSALGSGGEFDVPLWLVSKFATAGRAGRAFGDLLQPMLLPKGVSSIHTPRMTTGNVASVQTDGAAVNSQDVATIDAFSAVVTIAGEGEVSQQLLDQSPIGIDAAWYLDLTRAYNKALEFQLLYGTGASNGQLLGISNAGAINNVSGSGATTIATFWPLMGQSAAAIGNQRLLPPEAWLMAPRRWFWTASSVDASSRPISSPGNAGPNSPDLNPAGGITPFGPIQGVPVYLDGTIPAGTTPDDVFAVRPSDMFLWESAPRYITAQNPLSGTLQMKLSLHRYVAFIGNRYPNGIAKLSALPQPANF